MDQIRKTNGPRCCIMKQGKGRGKESDVKFYALCVTKKEMEVVEQGICIHARYNQWQVWLSLLTLVWGQALCPLFTVERCPYLRGQ